VARGVWNFKELQLTKFKIPIRVGHRTKGVQKAYDEAEINKKWEETEWAKRIVRKKLVRRLFVNP
jgi:large subunit ribosomal protein L14e